MNKHVCVCIFFLMTINFVYAERAYKYVRTVNPDSINDFKTVNEAIEDIQNCSLTAHDLGCIRIYPGTYAEQINSFYPGGNNLPAHCDLIGMGAKPEDVTIQHQRRSSSDPDFVNIVSEIYADGLLCEGDNLVENIKIHNIGQNQNSIEFRGTGTLSNCIVISKHDALTSSGHLAVKGCTIEGWYRPCIHAYSTFDISDSTFYPRTPGWGGQHPAGIKVTKSGSISNVTIQADIASSDYEPHYDTPWLAGIILQLRDPDDLVTITNANINLKLTTVYHDDRPEETADWELFGVVSGGRNPKPTAYYPGKAVINNCRINLEGVEDSSNPNGDGRAIMAAGVCIQGGGSIDITGYNSITTSRTKACYSDEGYEHSVINKNGVMAVDFENAMIDQATANGTIDPYEPPFKLPTAPGVDYFKKKAEEKAANLKVSPANNFPSTSPAIDFKTAKPLLFPPKQFDAADRNIPLSASGFSSGKPLAENTTAMSTGAVIDINSNITSNTVWTSDNTYHVTAPIDVDGALLYIEPGTAVTFAAGTRAGIRALNGGAIISCGTPDNPILFTSDSPTPAYNDYFCPLYIEETASSATKIKYSIFEWAYAGIIILNNDLDSNIENNYFVYCVYGIVEYGTEHTDIINNLCYGSYNSGIEVYMSSASGAADANSIIRIENNTCDYYQNNGITVHGVPDQDDAGYVFLANNIVSGSYQYGMSLVDGYMSAAVLNTGYYGNNADKNWAFNELNPVVVTASPYETASAGYAPICYLDQTCDFIDAGSLMPEQTSFMGKTTSTALTPDNNQADIGFHYPNWNFDNTELGSYYSSDFNEDNVVNNLDFAELSKGWLAYYDPNNPDSPNDPNDPNSIVDIYEPEDLTGFAGQWLFTGGPATDLSLTFNQNPNNLSGYAEAYVNITDEMISDVWLAINGEKIAIFNESDENTVVGFQTENLYNGAHSFKVMYLYDGNIITTTPVTVNVNNETSLLVGNEGFTPGETYHLFAIGSGNYQIEIDDFINSANVYSQTFTNGINAHIDPNIFAEEYGIYDLTVKVEDSNSIVSMEAGQSSAPSYNWKDLYERYLAREFKKKDLPPDSIIGIVISVGDKKLEKSKEKCWKAALKASVRKRIWPVFLNSKVCTWENLSHCLHLNRVKMWYHCSHGNYKLLGQPVRQCITTADGNVFSVLKKDYGDNVPSNYQKLSRGHEKKHSIAELGFRGTDKLTWVQFNACYSAKTGEFPTWLGITDPEDIGKQVFIGWKNSAKEYDLVGHYNTFEKHYWENLRAGNNLDDAVKDALLDANDTGEIEGNFITYGINSKQQVWFRYSKIW